MRYWVYDDEGYVFRKFWTKADTEKFMQPGWRLVVQPKPIQLKPTVKTYGEARW